MKITISRDELLKKLADIQGIVEKKTTMPILSHFLMEIKKSGSTIYATDLETAIKEPVETLEVAAEGSFCVSATKLYEITREMRLDLTIEQVDEQWIKIKSGNTTVRMAMLNPNDYPLWPVLDYSKDIKIPSSVLYTMIEKTINSAGENDTRYALNGILMHIKGADNLITIVGTDGHRLNAVTMELDFKFVDEIKVIIPRKAAMELKKQLTNLDQDVTLNVTTNHIKFSLGEKDFLTKLIDGTYPNYDSVIPKNNDKSVVINREEFIGVLRRVAVMSKERSHAIKLTLEGGSLEVSAADPEIGEATDKLAVQYSADRLTLGFNARYILESLTLMTADEVLFELLDTLSPTLLTEKGNQGFKCVLMPMRI